MSPSTWRVDQGEKRDAYLKIKSLNSYIMLDQNTVSAIGFHRNGSEFSCHVTEGLNQSLTLEALGCELRMADIYEGVVFSPEEPEA